MHNKKFLTDVKAQHGTSPDPSSNMCKEPQPSADKAHKVDLGIPTQACQQNNTSHIGKVGRHCSLCRMLGYKGFWSS